MVAPAGAGPCPQITSTLSLPLRTSCRITGTSPPGPLRCGSTTCSVKAVATAASKALPPRSRIPIPTAVAIQWVEVTTPKVPSITGRVVKGLGLMLPAMGSCAGCGSKISTDCPRLSRRGSGEALPGDTATLDSVAGPIEQTQNTGAPTNARVHSRATRGRRARAVQPAQHRDRGRERPPGQLVAAGLSLAQEVRVSGRDLCRQSAQQDSVGWPDLLSEPERVAGAARPRSGDRAGCSRGRDHYRGRQGQGPQRHGVLRRLRRGRRRARAHARRESQASDYG